MKNNLYTFSEKVWFVLFLNWTYGINTTKTFKTFCPIFWTLVVTIFFLPVILLVKAFGKVGTKALDNLRTYKQRKNKRLKDEFYKKYNNLNLSNKDAYYLVKSKCWDNFDYCLDTASYDDIRLKYRLYDKFLYNQKYQKKQSYKKVYTQTKESKWFTYPATIVSIGLIGFILYCLIQCVFMLYNTYSVNWYFWKIFGFIILTCCLFIVLFIYVISPFCNWFSCNVSSKCTLCKFPILSYCALPFIWLGRGFMIIVDMIIATYKNYCPMVTFIKK